MCIVARCDQQLTPACILHFSNLKTGSSQTGLAEERAKIAHIQDLPDYHETTIYLGTRRFEQRRYKVLTTL